MRRLSIALLALMLTGCCAVPAPVEWEYRVLAATDYYGVASEEQWLDLFTSGEMFTRLLKAKREWAAKGWDHASRRSGEGGSRMVFLRRDRDNPQPFEIEVLMHADLKELAAQELQGKIQAQVDAGWSLIDNNEVWLEFHRPM